MNRIDELLDKVPDVRMQIDDDNSRIAEIAETLRLQKERSAELNNGIVPELRAEKDALIQEFANLFYLVGFDQISLGRVEDYNESIGINGDLIVRIEPIVDIHRNNPNTYGPRYVLVKHDGRGYNVIIPDKFEYSNLLKDNDHHRLQPAGFRTIYSYSTGADTALLDSEDTIYKEIEEVPDYFSLSRIDETKEILSSSIKPKIDRTRTTLGLIQDALNDDKLNPWFAERRKEYIEEAYAENERIVAQTAKRGLRRLFGSRK